MERVNSDEHGPNRLGRSMKKTLVGILFGLFLYSGAVAADSVPLPPGLLPDAGEASPDVGLSGALPDLAAPARLEGGLGATSQSISSGNDRLKLAPNNAVLPGLEGLGFVNSANVPPGIDGLPAVGLGADDADFTPPGIDGLPAGAP